MYRSAQARLQAVEHPGEAEIELAKFQKAFGKWQDVFMDQQQTVIAAKEAELNVANLKCTELEAALNDVYSEVDKLSVAWETLDRQNKLKVFDLAALEEKLLKVTTEVSGSNHMPTGRLSLVSESQGGQQVLPGDEGQGNPRGRVQEYEPEHGTADGRLGTKHREPEQSQGSAGHGRQGICPPETDDPGAYGSGGGGSPRTARVEDPARV